MAFQDLNDLLKETVERLKGMLESDAVVGAPVETEAGTVVPVSKISFGFVSGGFDMKSRAVRPNGNAEEQPIAAIGGGVTVTPIGFLTLKNGCFVKMQEENEDKWTDILQSVIKKFAKEKK